jgi:Zn-dependent peptidase ImmA (M78 family)
MKWAVESSGWTTDEISRRLEISPNTLSGWLSGKINPTLNQLEALAASIKRPLAAFFLSTPPIEKPLPKDYRMLPGRVGKFDKKTVLAIRRARRLQRVSKELSDNINAATSFTLPKSTLSSSPLALAERYRHEFMFNEEKQKKMRTPYEVFNFLRDVIEEKNIVIFQISMPVDDARGFTLVDDVPAIIVVNSKDAIDARIFTLMHEFGHVLLQESGISMPENALVIRDIEKVEKWCNDFASAFLLPEAIARNIFNPNKSVITETETLNNFSRTYKLSKAMLLYNMAKFGYITQKQLTTVLDRYKPNNVKTKGKKSGGFGKSADRTCMSEKGQKFVSLVISNMEKGFITHSDALNYLSIKSKNLEKVTSKARK